MSKRLFTVTFTAIVTSLSAMNACGHSESPAFSLCVGLSVLNGGGSGERVYV